VPAEATKTRFERPQQRRGRLKHDFGAAGVSAEATKTRFKRPQQRRGRLKQPQFWQGAAPPLTWRAVLAGPLYGLMGWVVCIFAHLHVFACMAHARLTEQKHELWQGEHRHATARPAGRAVDCLPGCTAPLHVRTCVQTNHLANQTAQCLCQRRVPGFSGGAAPFQNWAACSVSTRARRARCAPRATRANK